MTGECHSVGRRQAILMFSGILRSKTGNRRFGQGRVLGPSSLENESIRFPRCRATVRFSKELNPKHVTTKQNVTALTALPLLLFGSDKMPRIV